MFRLFSPSSVDTVILVIKIWFKKICCAPELVGFWAVMVEPTVCTYHALKKGILYQSFVLGTEDLWIFWMIQNSFQTKKITQIPLESMWNHLEPWKKPFLKQITGREWITLFLEPRYILPALVCLLSTLTFYLKAWKGLRVRTFCSFSLRL